MHGILYLSYPYFPGCVSKGLSWVSQPDAPQVYWQAVASSGDGSKILAAGLFTGDNFGNGAIYLSEDSGKRECC